MVKEVDLLKVDLSGKGILYLVIAFVVVIAAFTLASWGFEQLRGLVATGTSKVADWTS